MLPRAILLALLLAAPLVQAQDNDGVRIYRCTDAKGHLSLRDSPCPKGQQQQARDMQRPKDAPPRPQPEPAAPPAPASAAPTVVYLVPPQPMYECTSYDGKRYTADNDDGNPRWVPYWTLGYPVTRSKLGLGNNIGGRTPVPGAPTQPPPHNVVWPVATGGGQWIRDACIRLPQQEACSRLRDRRSEIGTRFFNAMPSERDVLRVEERAIMARIDNDCSR